VQLTDIGNFDRSGLGQQARIERAPAVLGTRKFEGTLRSTLKKSLGLSRQIMWPGASAAAHVINSIAGDSLVKVQNVQLHFTWNLGYIGGIARSRGVDRSYGNRICRADVLPAGSEVEYIMERSNFKLLSIQFDPRFLLRSCELEHPEDIEIIETWDYEDPLGWELAKIIYKECADEAPQGFLYSETAMTLLALRVVRGASAHIPPFSVSGRGGLSPTHLGRACDYMMERMCDDISLQDVATAVGLSAGHFAFAFKRSLGVTPHAWLRRQRIDRAKRLLRDPTLDLTTIALTVGYANQSAFGVAFRRETGHTPGDYRRTC
jgi:AraC family transcriptional regulator